MAICDKKAAELACLCKKFRRDVIDVLHGIQTGHPGGSLSVCEILTVLYFHIANVQPENPCDPNRDRIILSKGHAAPMLYRVLSEKGFFPVEELKTLRQLNSRLQGHPNPHECPGIEMTSGPLGIALSGAVGLALGLKLDNRPSWVYAIIGDGETNEGVVWEACMAANKFRPDNLIIILDKNQVQLDGSTDDIMPGLDMRKKFEAFGLHVIECDGHDIVALSDAIQSAQAHTGKTSVIIANTVKGKGVSFMEGKNTWHGMAIGADDYAKAVQELGD